MVIALVGVDGFRCSSDRSYGATQCFASTQSSSHSRPLPRLLSYERAFSGNMEARFSLRFFTTPRIVESTLSSSSCIMNSRDRCVRRKAFLRAAAGEWRSVKWVDGMALRLRAAFFYVATAVAAIVLVMPMVAAHPAVLVFDGHRRSFHHAVARAWAVLSAGLFCELDVEGAENLPPPHHPAVYVSNHQSFLDIYALLTLQRNFKFISKTSVFLFPIVGWAMCMLGTIPLNRMDGRSQLECLKKCVRLVNEGTSVFFFPEGTRTKDGKLGVFKKGAFSVAAKTGAAVVPISVRGTRDLMPVGMEHVLKTGSVKLTIHPPIRGTDADDLCGRARSAISTAL